MKTSSGQSLEEFLKGHPDSVFLMPTPQYEQFTKEYGNQYSDLVKECRYIDQMYVIPKAMWERKDMLFMP